MTFINDTGISSPVLDYSSRDYLSIYSDLVQRIPVYLPEWTSQSSSDFGIVLLQMYAYVGDLLGYYIDRLAGEAFIQTATQPVSIINLAAMLDYQPTLSVGSSVVLQITIGTSIAGPLTIPAGTQFSTIASASQPAIIFFTDSALTIAGASGATPSFSGSVTATQGITYSNEAVATSDGSVNQIYPLQNTPVSANGFVVSVDLGLGPQEWTYVQSLINSGPFDQVYTNFVDANGIFYVVFGDGVNGLVPTLGSPITCTYQINVGTTGNVGAGTIVAPVGALVGVVGVTNPASASGGTGAESLASIQQNAPASLKTLNRGVTVGDIQTLAGQVSGVEWASAQLVTYQLVNIFVAPFGGGPPSTILEDAVLNYMEPLLMANTTVTVLPPTYVGVNVAVNVVAFDNFGNTAVQATVLAALNTLLSLSNTGFGFRVSLGLVYQTILEQPGVNYAQVTGLNRQVLATLTSALSNTVGYNSIAVSALPQPIVAGDQLVLSNGTTSLTLSALAPAAAGAELISVAPFTANATYPLGSTIQDTTFSALDCIFLPNEIPIAGTFIVAVTGGFIGS